MRLERFFGSWGEPEKTGCEKTGICRIHSSKQQEKVEK